MVFAAIAGVAVLTALLALLSREVVHTIIWIGGFFIALASIYFLLQANFLGVLQLAVYAGAVTILLLFAVMVIKKRMFAREAITGVNLVPLLLAFLVAVVLVDLAATLPGAAPTAAYDVTWLSQNLFGLNGAWLILLGLLMLSALVGSIHLARERREIVPPREATP